jgi:tRNA 2-thiouridine synthesizing protein E
MDTVTVRGKSYHVCGEGFLINPDDWDEDFADAMAAQADIPSGLTDQHWEVIRFIREFVKEKGRCPLVYETCDANALYLEDLQRLFPTGYQRGACRIAGVTYREGYLGRGRLRRNHKKPNGEPLEKTYRVDVRGFLVDPDDWDEEYAAAKACEMKLASGLTDRHWQIISFVRDSYRVNGTIPTVYETCQANAATIDELEQLFPDGYHRGVVKIAGLRLCVRPRNGCA